jgi:uncharacterized membrane protein YeaQ/YmgE (transglycosylase-associated protein family)
MEPWILVSLAVGLVLAVVAYFAAPGRIRGGVFLTMGVGALGAVAATWLGRQVGAANPGHTFGFFTAMIGTGLVLAIWRTAMGRESRDH